MARPSVGVGIYTVGAELRLSSPLEEAQIVSRLSDRNIKEGPKVKYSDVENAVKKNFTRYLHDTIPITLPSNCRYYQSNEEYQAFLIEVKPQVFQIKYDEYVEDIIAGNYENRDDIEPTGETITRQLAMPWQYFWFIFYKAVDNDWDISHTLHGVNLYWSLERITDIRTARVFPARLPNINHDSGRICLGDAYPPSNLPVNERIDTIVQDFYGTSLFNADLEIVLPIAYRSFANWEASSRDDKYTWMGWLDRLYDIRQYRDITQFTEWEGRRGSLERFMNDLSIWQLYYDAIQQVEYERRLTKSIHYEFRLPPLVENGENDQFHIQLEDISVEELEDISVEEVVIPEDIPQTVEEI